MPIRLCSRKTLAYASKIWVPSRRCLNGQSTTLPPALGTGTYEEGDRVLLKYQDARRFITRLLPPLSKEGESFLGKHKGVIKHANIIGQPSGRLNLEAIDRKGQTYKLRITQPTFDQFVSLTPRSVTPIYASYSAFMTNLLDIHVEPPTEGNETTASRVASLQILEAGTGHGSLTMHLARAIAAANPPLPNLLNISDSETIAKKWERWKSSRKAILHTVEYQANRSKASEKTIRSFRGGLYSPHIDFYSGDVGAWAQTQAQNRIENNESPEFLDVVCLDMPAPHEQLERVHQAMKNYGQLLVYTPQITQLAACQQEIERLGLPFKLDQIIELGEGISSGRVWDLRFIKTRAEGKIEQNETEASLDVDSEVDLDETDQESSTSASISSIDISSDPDITSATDTGNSNIGIDCVEQSEQAPDITGPNTPFPTMVCRPMVGRLIMGGAFVGLWRKLVRN